MEQRSQELRMLFSVTLDCQVTKIVMNLGSQWSELNHCLKGHKSLGLSELSEIAKVFRKTVKILKLVKTVKNCKNCQTLSKIVKFVYR